MAKLRKVLVTPELLDGMPGDRRRSLIRSGLMLNDLQLQSHVMVGLKLRHECEIFDNLTLWYQTRMVRYLASTLHEAREKLKSDTNFDLFLKSRELAVTNRWKSLGTNAERRRYAQVRNKFGFHFPSDEVIGERIPPLFHEPGMYVEGQTEANRFAGFAEEFIFSRLGEVLGFEEEKFFEQLVQYFTDITSDARHMAVLIGEYLKFLLPDTAVELTEEVPTPPNWVQFYLPPMYSSIEGNI